jgi:mono/diheme cytochrome c family protein
MRLRILGGTLLVVWAVSAVSAMSAEPQAAAPTSVLERIYGRQAKRGEALYAQTCANCHGATLAGGEMAPAPAPTSSPAG